MEGTLGFVSTLFQGEECLGEMLVVPQEDADPSFIQHLFGSKICFSFLSPGSERGLHPLTCLPTIASIPAPLFKMCSTEAQSGTDSLRLDLLHKSCLEESKTAVVLMDDGNELHLVAMGSQAGGAFGIKHCFWAYLTREGVYASCLGMLNLRCLAMVFDLDETLLVANTMRSFENRIELLERRLYGPAAAEMDPVRRTGMIAEAKRYQEDRDLLKQFVDNDQIFDNGNVIEAQEEVVPPLADGALPLVRPIIRLPDRNVVLTRINPSVRDTSVLVRLRPAWEELRGYLIAKGRKRFEVYICTMAEREYALEMWRLLDPDAGLINSRELMERVVCVKSGNKKSLANVFPDHRCHPNLAMIVDDRLKVWEESDQPQVHVVPAFAPYSAPHAEVNSGLGVPALRVAKNVVCNVRAAFFKQFDETLSQQVLQIQFESGFASVPMPLDISNCLQAAETKNNLGHIPSFRAENEEMRSAVNSISPQIMQPVPGAAVAVALPQALASNVPPLLPHEIIAHPLTPEESRPADVLPESFNAELELLLPPHHQRQAQAALLRTALQPNSARSSSPVREEEGEVPESELDPDTRRRLLILQHGMDTNHTRDIPNFDEHSPFPGSGNIPPPTGSGSGSAVSPYTGGEEEMSPGRPTRTSTEPLSLKPESPPFDSQHDLHDLHDLQGPPPGFADGPYLSSNHDRSSGGPGPVPLPQDPRRRLPQDSNKRFVLDEMKPPQVRPDAFSDQPQHPYLGGQDGEAQALSSSRKSAAAGVQQQQELPLLHIIRQQHQHMNFVEILQVVGDKLSAKVDYKGSLASSSTRLLFNVEVTFNGQKVGEGTGSTKKEARIKAAEAALWFLTSLHPDTFMHIQQLQLSAGGLGGSNSRVVDEEAMLGVHGGSRDTPRLRPPPGLLGGGPLASTPGGLEMDYLDVANQGGQINFVAILKERCTIQGVNVNFQDLPTTGDASRRFFNCQVEVDRQVLGRGSGLSWEIAKQHAAEEALRQLKRSDTPRSPPVVAAKRVRMGFGAAPSPSSRGGRRGRGRGRSPPRRRPPGQ